MLFAARNAVKLGIPVFPVNLGQFGFIASVQPFEWKNELETFLDGDAFIEKRAMLDVKVFRDSKVVYSSLIIFRRTIFRYFQSLRYRGGLSRQSR